MKSLYPTGRCSELSHPSLAPTILSLLIMIGIFVSYAPQHKRIISRHSSEGLSPWFVLLGTTSSTFSLFNIMSLPITQTDIGCCAVNSRWSCFAGLLGVGQVFAQWQCFVVILALFLIFFPQPGPEPHPSDAPERPTYRTALFVVLLSILHCLILLVLSVVFLLWYPKHLQTWATVLGLFAALLACIQYLPQLWTTWKLQNVMSLSIPMMCIQTPGSFVFAGSLAARLGVEGWSSWGMYVVTGLLQGCLLGMGIWFELRDRRLKRTETGTEAQVEADERTALLRQ